MVAFWLSCRDGVGRWWWPHSCGPFELFTECNQIPFTPFHFGPGLLFKACSPRHFWLTSFIVSNILIDLEVLYYLWLNDPPIHRYTHTYAGGIMAGILAGLLMFCAVQILLRMKSARWRWFQLMSAIPRRRLFRQSVVAGLIGGLSHIFLDSLIHRDMNPWWPLRDGNVLAGTVSVASLHIGLALAGVFGLLLWLLLSES